MDDFYAARDNTMPSLPWPSIAPPFTLQQAAERGEISAGDAEVRAWALMGIAKTLGERFVLWEEGEVDIERVVAEAHQFICNGLAP